MSKMRYNTAVKKVGIIMQDFNPIYSEKLYIQIYNQLHDAIVAGKYKVGDKLPSEKDLCNMFNVSRVPVREALCALELNGLVISQQGLGVRVKEQNVKGTYSLQDIEPEDIIIARMALEPAMAREAALNITSVEKVNIQEIINRFKEERQHNLDTLESDNAFHKAIARASKNNIFISMMDMLLRAMEQPMWVALHKRTFNNETIRNDSFDEHQRIALAILSNDAEQAYQCMSEHMKHHYARYWSE